MPSLGDINILKTGLVGIGVGIALVYGIIFCILLGVFNNYVSWFFYLYYIWVGMAGVAMLFTGLGTGNRKSQIIITIVLCIFAVIASFVISIIYIVLIIKCYTISNSLGTGNTLMCDNEMWLVWVSAVMGVVSIVVTAIGGGITIYYNTLYNAGHDRLVDETKPGYVEGEGNGDRKPEYTGVRQSKKRKQNKRNEDNLETYLSRTNYV